MKPELKSQWIEALRSGKYLQKRGALRKVSASGSVGYCCLGVLCEVAGHNPDAQFNFGFISSKTAESLGLPVAGEEEITRFVNGGGLVDDMPNSSFQLLAAGRNDRGWTFEQIADWIAQQDLETTP